MILLFQLIGKLALKKKKQLKAIIKKYGQKISKGKKIRYDNNEYKKITGFVIFPQHQLVVPNKTRLKIKKKILQIENIKKVEIGLKNSLLGLINFTELSKKNAYRWLKNQLKKSC